jgi:tetratricopeptide (TPR) repeat protein
MTNAQAIVWRSLVAILGILPLTAAAAQTTQYRSPAGMEYVSQPDTGGVARAESALAADPQNVERIIQMGIAQSAIRRYREAIATFTRGIAIAPNNGVLYRWRGHRYLSTRQFDLARADLEHGLALDSTLYGCWYHLGIVRYVTGDYAGAADAFAHARPLAPEPGERAGSFDWSWMSLSRAGRAAEAAELLLHLPDSLPPENAYTKRLQLYRGLADAEHLITAADSTDIAVATLSYGIGNWYLVTGDTTRARPWFERSVRSGGWPAFAFIASEAELVRLR